MGAPPFIFEMTNPNPENPPVVDTGSSSLTDSRRRLRELLSIPERDRTDEQWDEIIELEIQLAPGNRIGSNDRAGGGGHGHPGKQSHGGGGGGQQQKKHRPRNNNNNNNNGGNNNRRPRQKKGPGDAGGTPAA